MPASSAFYSRSNMQKGFPSSLAPLATNRCLSVIMSVSSKTQSFLYIEKSQSIFTRLTFGPTTCSNFLVPPEGTEGFIEVSNHRTLNRSQRESYFRGRLSNETSGIWKISKRKLNATAKTTRCIPQRNSTRLRDELSWFSLGV